MELKSARQLKKDAYSRLSECWGESVAIFFIVTGIIFAELIILYLMTKFLYAFDVFDVEFPEILTSAPAWYYILIGVMMIGMVILSVPLHYGISWYLMQEVSGNSVPAGCFFSCYTSPKLMKQTILLQLSVSLRKLIAGLPFVIIGVIEINLAASAITSTESKFVITVVAVCLVLLLACLIGFYLMYSFRYFAVPYLFAENPDKKPRDIIRESSAVIYGRESYLIEVYYSLAGVMLLCILIFPAIYIVPYARMTLAEAANELIDSYRTEQQKLNNFIGAEAVSGV